MNGSDAPYRPPVAPLRAEGSPGSILWDVVWPLVVTASVLGLGLGGTLATASYVSPQAARSGQLVALAGALPSLAVAGVGLSRRSSAAGRGGCLARTGYGLLLLTGAAVTWLALSRLA